MESFLLILTLCGTLNGNTTCEKYVIDHNLTRIDCLESISTVYNNEKTGLYDIIGDMGKDWDLIRSNQLHCVAENKE